MLVISPLLATLRLLQSKVRARCVMIQAPSAFPLGHQMILASAGSGKTHDLTTRFLTLMAAGVGPEKIIALTFSRKSAGEFFNRILRRLAEAASSERSAAELEAAMQEQEAQRRQHLGVTAPLTPLREPLTQALAQSLLVLLVRRLHRLMLGTMDSFFIRMARAFPLELGLGGEFGILDAQSELAAQQRIFHQLFQPQGSSRADQQEFIQAFQQATHGREEAGMVRNLNAFLKDCRSYFEEARAQQAWGQPDVIWAQGDPPRDPGKSLAEAAQDALTWLATGSHGMTGVQAEVLQRYLEPMLDHAPLLPLDKSASGTLEKLVEIYDDLQRGSAVIKLQRKDVTLDPMGCQRLLEVLDAHIWQDFEAGCQQMQGVWRMLHRYDQYYETMVRQQGKLTFGDVQQLLTGELADVHAEDPQGLAAQRELLAFRLDAQYDHWLLDEFQDTNGRQWRILEPLLDEVLQDDTGLRTFFAVGDTKQAIHMWRGSNPDLMGRILHHYNQADTDLASRIATLAKSVSWRCAPSVLALANAALGDQPALDHFLPAGTLAGGWEFQRHEAAPKNLGLKGHAEVLVAQKSDTEITAGESKADACYEIIAARLREQTPLARGLSCAVLVQTNNQATAVADALRTLTGMLVTCETDTAVVNGDAATTGFLELLRLAAHPGNTFARRHLEMSPWSEVAAQRFPNLAGSAISLAASEVRRQAVHEGMAAVVRDWTTALRVARPDLPAYSRERLTDLTNLAATFDAEGRRDLDAFILLATDHTQRQGVTPQSIQVMTTFKAKGLEWDIVYFTGLESPGHAESYGLSYDEERRLQWITKLPIKSLAMCNPTIQAMEEAAQRWRWRQNICLLYVALTRAKRSTHVVLAQPPKKSTSKNLATLLLEVLPPQENRPFTWDGGSAEILWQSEDTDAAWYVDRALQEAPPPSPAPEPPPIILRKLRLPKRRPSDAAAQHLFSRERHHAMALGTAVHALAAQLTWLDETPLTSLTHLAVSLPAEFRNLAVRQLQISLQKPEIIRCFTRPEHPLQLWRERDFVLEHEGSLISGTFDRVVLELDDQGTPISARLLEFKTDVLRGSGELTAAVKRYTSQVHQYRLALAKLLALSEWAVHCELVFLSKGVVVKV